MQTTPDPRNLTDPGKIRTLMANAERLKRQDVVQACFKRLCQVAGMNYDDPLERRFWETLAAYEESLAKKHGKRQSANYTRRKVVNKGIRQALTDWALDPNATAGFKQLAADGLIEFSAEYVVMEFAKDFPANVVAAARKRLEEHGVNPDQIKAA
jgi:hypothetical protein